MNGSRRDPRPYDPDTQRILFIVGAGKAGSTTLFDHISQHPQIATAPAKEPEFYSDPAVFGRGLEWYVSSFGSGAIASGKCLLDASSHYSQYPCAMDAAALIRRDFPVARFAYIVRDPADRWYSNYQHIMRNGIDRTPEEVFDQEPRLLMASSYGYQYGRYLRHFPADSLMTVTLTQLAKHPEQTVGRVLAHVGLSADDLPPLSDLRSNEGGADHFVRSKTTSKLFAFPGGDTVRRMIPATLRASAFDVIRRSPLGERRSQQWDPPPLSDALRDRIYDELSSDIAEFESLTGIDVSTLAH